MEKFYNADNIEEFLAREVNLRWVKNLKTRKENVWHMFDEQEQKETDILGTLEMMSRKHEVFSSGKIKTRNMNVHINDLYFKILEKNLFSPDGEISIKVEKDLSVEWQKFMMQEHGVDYANKILNRLNSLIYAMADMAKSDDKHLKNSQEHFIEKLEKLKIMKANAEEYIETVNKGLLVD